MLLRPRQYDFVERTLTALTERGNALAVAPTGFGKTVALAATVGRLLAGGGRGASATAPRRIAGAECRHFRAMDADIPTSVVDAGARTVPTDLLARISSQYRRARPKRQQPPSGLQASQGPARRARPNQRVEWPHVGRRTMKGETNTSQVGRTDLGEEG